MVGTGGLVEKQPDVTAVVRHREVEIAVVVHVGHGGTAADRRFGAQTSLDRDVRAVATVAEQLVRLMQRVRIAGARQILESTDGAVHDVDIEPPVVVVIDPAGTEAGERVARRAQPGERRTVVEAPAPIVDVQGVGLLVEVRHEQVFVAVAVEVGGVDPHAGLRLAVRVERAPGEQRRVRERAVAAIDPELVGQAVVGDVEVEPAVAVEVPAHDAESRTVVGRDARLGGDRPEGPVTIVVEQSVGDGQVAVRPAVVFKPVRSVALLVGRKAPVEVIGDVEIEPTVTIDVDESRADRPP